MRWRTRRTTPRGAPAILAHPPLSALLRRTLREFSRTQYGGILSQLRAGARYQDFRISTASHTRPRASPDEFWLVHGAVACVPLGDALADMAAFAAEAAAAAPDGRPPTVVTVCRLLGGGWDKAACAALAGRVEGALGAAAIYGGDARALRRVPFDDLPAWVVAGVPGLGALPDGAAFGTDVWINTYSPEEKAAGLAAQVAGVAARAARDDLYVLGWTVTPQPRDIGLRLASAGWARPSLEREAERFNARFAAFAEEHGAALRERCNVVFFDFITPELAAAVRRLDGRLQA